MTQDVFSHSLKFNNAWAILVSAVMITASTVMIYAQTDKRIALLEQKVDYIVKLIESEDTFYREIGLKIADHERRLTIIETTHKGQ